MSLVDRCRDSTQDVSIKKILPNYHWPFLAPINHEEKLITFFTIIKDIENNMEPLQCDQIFGHLEQWKYAQ